MLIGDAAYTSVQYQGPADQKLPRGQAVDEAAWHDSIGRLRALDAARVHFCHDTAVVHG